MPMDLNDVQRDLQKKIDKARPLMKQIDSGDLKVLNDQQQNTKTLYPQWIAELEEVKSGVMPKRFTEGGGGKRPTPAAPAAPAASNYSSSTVGAAVTASGKSNKQLKREKQQQKKQQDQEIAELDENEKLIHQFYKAPSKTRNALIDAHIGSQIDKSHLQTLTKEFDEVAALRREILTGRLASPSKVQEAKVDQADSIKKELAMEKEKVKLQSDRLRSVIIAQIEELQDKADAAAQAEKEEELAKKKSFKKTPKKQQPQEEEEDEPEEEAAPAAEAATPEEDAAADEPIAADESPREDTPPPAADEEPAQEEEEEVSEEAKKAAEEEAAAQKAAEEEAAAKEAEEEEAARVAAAEAEAKEKAERAAARKKEQEEAAAKKAEEEAAAKLAAEEEAAAKKAAEEEERRKPKVYDWSEIGITKNRYQLPPAGERVESPTETSTKSPSPIASPVRRDPMHFEVIVFDGTNASAAAKKDAPKAGKKGGKGGASPKGSPTSNSSLSQTAVTRLQRDFEFVKKNPVPGVTVDQPSEDIFSWAINVSPGDGPLAGSIIPLECKFSELYPQQPPTVRSLVEVPHPSVVVLNGQRNALCMPQLGLDAAGQGWSPAFGVYAILQHLQNFFSDEGFSKSKMAKAGPFKQSVNLAKAELSRIQTDYGHSTAAPFPAQSNFINGPFTSQDNLNVSGAVQQANKGKKAQAVWTHSYSGDKHTFNFAAEVSVAGSALVGVVTNPKDAEKTFTGFNLSTGAVSVSGEETNSEGSSVNAGDVIFFGIDTINGKLTRNNGDAIELKDHSATTTYHPTVLFSNGGSVRLICSTAPNANLEEQLAAPAAPVEESDSAITCFVTKGTPTDSIMGVGLHVVHNAKNQLPVSVEIAEEYISEVGFQQLKTKRSPAGQKMECFLPVLLGEEHTAKITTPLLKKYVTRACRNPNAATAYEPPFRANHAALLFPLALNGLTSDFARNPSADVADAVRMYTRIVHTFTSLASQHSDIVSESSKLIKSSGASAPESGTIIAMSCVLEDMSWSQIVTTALRAEFANSSLNASSTDDELLKKLPRTKRKVLLTGAAFARATSIFPLERAVETFTKSAGEPSADVIQEIEQAILTQLVSVRTWDDVCNFLGVNVSAADIFE